MVVALERSLRTILRPPAIWGLMALLTLPGGAQVPAKGPVRYQVLSPPVPQATTIPFVPEDLGAMGRSAEGARLRAFAKLALAAFERKYGHRPTTDLQIAMALADWVASVMLHPAYHPSDPGRPRYNPLHDPAYNQLNPDPLKMLLYTLRFDPRDAEKWPSPQCGHQNRVLAGLLNSVGLHARVVTLQLHRGLEFYSFQLHKWIYIDATHNEHYVLRGGADGEIPLGVRELHELTLAHRQAEVEVVKHGYPDIEVVYLAIHPYGFLRYALLFYMKQLGPAGKAFGGASLLTAVTERPLDPVRDRVWTPDDPQQDPTEPFWFTLNSLSDPGLLDPALDALTLAGPIATTPEGLEFVLESRLPYTAGFERSTLEREARPLVMDVDTPGPEPVKSPTLRLPRGAGKVTFRAFDTFGNRTQEFVIHVD